VAPCSPAGTRTYVLMHALGFGFSNSSYSSCVRSTRSVVFSVKSLTESACHLTGYCERMNSARSTSIKTQHRPILAPGTMPRFARVRTSSGCMCRNAAASRRLNVFMCLVLLRLPVPVMADYRRENFLLSLLGSNPSFDLGPLAGFQILIVLEEV